tara:strand:- start:38 stop:187 length:150 start_codon:yes stop_codon:yes gene_type:complete
MNKNILLLGVVLGVLFFLRPNPATEQQRIARGATGVPGVPGTTGMWGEG